MRILIAAALLIGTSSIAAAEQKGWICKVKEISGAGFVPREVGLVMDTQRKTSFTIDPIAMKVNGKPTTSKLKKIRGSKWRFSWRVNNVPANPVGMISVSYRAELDPANNTVRFAGNIPAYPDTQIRGSGTCSPIDPSRLSG